MEPRGSRRIALAKLCACLVVYDDRVAVVVVVVMMTPIIVTPKVDTVSADRRLPLRLPVAITEQGSGYTVGRNTSATKNRCTKKRSIGPVCRTGAIHGPR